MRFKDWLREVSTSTGDIATFARIAIGATDYRMYPEPIVMQIDSEDEKKKERKKGKNGKNL